MGKTTYRVFGLASSARAGFLTVAAISLSYATALLAVSYVYRRGYGIVGKPELVLQSMATSLARVCS